VRKNSECKTSCACNNDPFFVASSDPVPCTVLDLFAGAATTLLVAEKLGRRSIGIELNPEYAVIASERLAEYSRNTKAPWEDGYIPKEIEEDSVIEEMSFDDLLG
jgi:predicted RNA methylase